MSASQLPFKVRVASPCHARWSEMTGDERARFCDLCQKKVYDLSTLSRPDAEALIKAHEGRLCVRFYQRADGTVLTNDCPVGAVRYWQKVRWSMATAAALLLTTVVSVFGRQNREETARRGNNTQTIDAGVTKVKTWMGVPQPMPIIMGAVPTPPIMGKLSPTPPRTNAPTSTVRSPAK